MHNTLVKVFLLSIRISGKLFKSPEETLRGDIRGQIE
jgi:hypothetical protein